MVGIGILFSALLPPGCGQWTGWPSAQRGGKQAALTSPVRIAAGGGALLVTDNRAQAVFFYSETGMQKIYSFPVNGVPLAVGSAGALLYIGNETNGSVEVYDLFGKWQFDLGGAKGLIPRPQDLAIDEGANRVFVVDGSDASVKVYDLGGAAQGAIIDPARIINPTAIALDTANRLIFLSDYGNVNAAFGNPARVHTYSYTGTYIRSITGSSGEFSRPQGLAYDQGRLFLADAVLGQIVVFDSVTGAKLKTLGSFGTGPGELQLPLDVVVDPVTKDVYVTNNRAARIELFAGGGVLP